MARPKLDIDPKLVESLAGIGCTTEEIAGVLGCSRDTIEKRFSAELHKGRGSVKIKLRRIQLRLAEKNAAMAIFLGKQLLKQSDQPRDQDAAQLDYSVDLSANDQNDPAK